LIAHLLRPAAVAVAGLTLASASSPGPARQAEVLRAVRALPPHIAGRFFEPLAYQQAASGQYFVFDRRAHTVFGVDEARDSSWQIVQVGFEQGRLLQPRAFDLAPDGTFVVADAPGGRERVQFFGAAGARLDGFSLPGRSTARVEVGGVVLNGVGSVQYSGTSVVVSHPESGWLISEYSRSGWPQRSIGRLRATGQEADRDVHLALNSGLPLIDPTGGFYYVFQTGVPLFRKYDAGGNLVYERHIEGREIDAVLASQPTRWPRRTNAQGDELPFVQPVVRAAAVDPAGVLWIALVVPYTYVYEEGEKTRLVQFRGAGLLSPTSLSFTADGRLLVTPGCFEFRTTH
jgi:hypothetical protein